MGGGAERDRDVWAKAGVLVNELARPALFLNLPMRGCGKPQSVAGRAGLRFAAVAVAVSTVVGRGGSQDLCL